MTVTNALSQQTTIVSNMTIGRPTSVTDALGKTTTYTYDSYGRLTRVTEPEGNYTQYTYDARGNLTETRQVAKPGSGLADIVNSATYVSSCTNPVTCNSPLTTTDAKGNVTEYTFDATHGGVTSVKSPAATTGGMRPETRYGYTLINGEYQVTSVSTCQTTTSCVGTADETKATVTYDSNNNVTSVTKGAGNGSVTQTATMVYDAKGDLLTVDGPLSGNADTVRYRYDAARRKIGTVNPDPDGSGPRKHAANRITYDTAGRVTAQSTGTVNSQSDSDWTAFSPAETVLINYDANGRPIKSTLSAGGAAKAVQQTSYDALGRVDCSAQRMDPAQWSAQTNACVPQTSGPDGPDRVTKQIYDNVGRVAKVQTAYGTTAQSDEAIATYTNNGQLATLTDGEGNKTTYEYDGHDRLAKTRYPSPTTDGVSSTTDYEAPSYDANSNATSVRLRDGQTINLGYDNLNRVVSKDLPGSEPDATYSYDLKGRMTSAVQGGQTLTNSYDALDQVTSTTGPLGTNTYTYDAAGHRTSFAYPGSGLTVNYDYDVVGNVTAIRENGASSGAGVLASYTYDDLGRRTAVSYGNGTSTSYAYDPVSRLASLSQDLSGTAQDGSTSFTYNPASQIKSSVRNNDTYAWSNHYNMDKAEVANGLNQLTSQGSTALSYDGRGNVTGIGSSAYGYSSENLLKSAPGATLSYDPALRLYEVIGAGTTTRFAYDGQDMIAEYNGSNALQRRYVHGPGMDEPIVQYEGSGTTDKRWLHSDERGSIIATTNASGTATAINSYDDTGNPAATNTGRFQYTGQTRITEATGPVLYHYKARAYAPATGRFMQSDPIGYGDGMNIYAYVKGDAVNGRDPSGLFEWVCKEALVQVDNNEPSRGTSCYWKPEPGDSLYVLIYLDAYTDYGRYDDDVECPLINRDQVNFMGRQFSASGNVAEARKINPILLVGLAAHESGWGSSNFYKERNNPFGATPGGDRTDGVRYGSFEQAWSRWSTEWGPRLSGLGADNGVGFRSALLQDNRNSVNAVDRRGAYNSQKAPEGDPKWQLRVQGAITQSLID